ncbi:TPA: hypothetical protein ACNV18_004878 [Pseudomonas putida]|mgnify:CR=1 FL=1
MMTRSAVMVQDIQPFTKEQCDKLLLHFKDTSDFRGVALVALLSDGYRYTEIVSARVSVERDEDGYFADIIRNAVPSLYIYSWLRDWIKFADLKPGDLLFYSKRSKSKPMTAIALRELVKNWLCIMGCEAEADMGAVSRFRQKVAAMPRNRIGG